MKIVRIESFPIRVPRAQRFQAAQGVLTHSDFAVVVVETDAGMTGYGEISSALFYYRLGPAHARDVNDYLAPALVGEDPLRIPALVERMDRALRGARQAKSGVEMALWDIAGKAAALPVYRLLRGKARGFPPAGEGRAGRRPGMSWGGKVVFYAASFGLPATGRAPSRGSAPGSRRGRRARRGW